MCGLYAPLPYMCALYVLQCNRVSATESAAVQQSHGDTVHLKNYEQI